MTLELRLEDKRAAVKWEGVLKASQGCVTGQRRVQKAAVEMRGTV